MCIHRETMVTAQPLASHCLSLWQLMGCVEVLTGSSLLYKPIKKALMVVVFGGHGDCAASM